MSFASLPGSRRRRRCIGEAVLVVAALVLTGIGAAPAAQAVDEPPATDAPLAGDPPEPVAGGLEYDTEENEPNDTKETADPLSAALVMRGEMHGGGAATGSPPRYLDVDLFRLHTPQAGTAALQFEQPQGFSTTEANAQLAILNSAGHELFTRTLQNGDTISSSGIPVPAGDLYVIVVVKHASQQWRKPYVFSFGMEHAQPPKPTISGTAYTGGTLTAHPGNWSPGVWSFEYQWLRDGKTIPDATDATYTLTAADAGKAIAARVSGFNGAYLPLRATSASLHAPFIDVQPGSKFFSEIQWMSESGVTTGSSTPAGLAYLPKSGVTREAMAAFLYRLYAPAGYRPAGPSPFVDVPAGHRFALEISWMRDAGISTGTSTSRGLEYRPKDPVSREAMAAFLYRLKGNGASAPATGSPFVDVPRSHRFFREISWMRSAGISTGTSTPNGPVYQPKDAVSREAMAAFLYRVEH
ncbi:MAG: S-layer homology domain-containing protein [Leucobacter sp.]